MTRHLIKLILICMLLNILFVSVHSQWKDDDANNNDLDNNNENGNEDDNDNNNNNNRRSHNNDNDNDNDKDDDNNNNGNNNDDDDQDDDEDDDAKVDQQWDCNHDKEDHDEPEFTDVDEDGFADRDNNDRERNLASATNMRFYGYYGFVSGDSTTSNYLKNWLIPPILAYFESTLKVRYPVNGPLQITSGSICSHSTPSVLRNGVNADFVYMFSSTSASGTWVASTSACKLATGSHRPLVGQTTVNTKLFKAATNNILLHEKNTYAIMHELTHALGFSSSLFKYFLGSTGNGASVVSGNLGGKSTTVLVASPLTEMVRSHFGCSSARGGFMENNGPAGAVAGSHFERRLFGFEAMTAYLVYEMKYSKFTLGLLESSGWYYPDYSMADPFFWGQGQGCTFFSASCSSANSKFTEFCSGSGRRCANPGRGAGSCSSDTVSDSCKFIHPGAEYDCGNPSAANYARLPNIQTFGRGTGSKCFEGTLGGSSTTTYCFKSSCSGSGSNTVLNIQVGSRTVECTAKGSKTVAGYSGTINCPDPARFCSTAGKAVCPRGCMGRGKCSNGRCSCYSGFKGEDCGLPA